MRNRKTEALIFTYDGEDQLLQCRYEPNGCFSIGSASIRDLARFFGVKDPNEISIKRWTGDVMKLDHLRARDDRWIIWNSEHEYGKRGESKKGDENA